MHTINRAVIGTAAMAIAVMLFILQLTGALAAPSEPPPTGYDVTQPIYLFPSTGYETANPVYTFPATRPVLSSSVL